MFAMCLLALMATSLSVKAQEITITLSPYWNWISYPHAVPMELNEALGDFVPAEGDIIKSRDAFVVYQNGVWSGVLTHFMPGRGYMYRSARTETVSFVFATPSSSVVATATPTDVTAVSAVAGGMVMLPEGSHVFLRGVCWGTGPNPTIDDNHITIGTGIGSFSDILTELSPGTTYYVRAYVVSDYGLAYGNQQNFTTVIEYQYVDLGLPSGTLWATCNVGADNPEDYGDYFAWGETEPKNDYSWSTYQYCMGSNNTLTKYCNDLSCGYNLFHDNLTILLPEDDAAMANWGADWRMPTEEEWQELYNNTTHTWTTQNGVSGMLFTASNGNSFFLPAAGRRWNTEFDDDGICGYYWSSSLNLTNPNTAWFFDFNSNSCGMSSYRYRSNGHPVRPVRAGSQNASFFIDATANPTEGGEISGAGTYQEGTECTLTATANEGYTFTNWTENDEVVSVEATYTFTVNVNRTLVANFTSNGGGDDHEYVDLGLPSGLLWATCNVGAETPEDYGDYFAWGETMPKGVYNWNTYQYCMGSENTLTKYCNKSSYGYNGFIDNLTTLLPEDDAATANWGSSWRMPTVEDWEELYNNTTVTWTTQNGVRGRLFTASNGNSLFLPAAGVRWDGELNYTGDSCHYWSSSRYTSDPSSAWDFYSEVSGIYVIQNRRYFGHSVRAVSSSPQN